jgi:hypothetical protein
MAHTLEDCSLWCYKSFSSFNEDFPNEHMDLIGPISVSIHYELTDVT